MGQADELKCITGGMVRMNKICRFIKNIFVRLTVTIKTPFIDFSLAPLLI